MAILSWGVPTVEFTASVDREVPASAVWTAFPEIKENTTKLVTTRGEKKTAKSEGGKIVDTKTSASEYTFELEIFVKKGDTRPIDDTDGVIVDDYAFRLTPEDSKTKGYLAECTSVSVEETWSSEEGALLKYYFDVKLPKTGKMLKEYVKP